MNHHLAKTYRKRRLLALLVVILILFVFFLQKGLLKGVNSFFSGLVRPIWQAENFTADFLSMNLSSKSDLYKQNILLKDSLKKKDADLAQFDSLKEENNSLKEILGRVDKDSKIVLSAILAKPNITPYDTLIIDRGDSSGIKPDDLVFANGNILIGEIDSVEKNSARVLMYSTPGNISQVILGDSGKYFNAHGIGGGTMEVEVSREIEVAVGDSFFYPGLDKTLVGVVKKIDFDPRDSFKKVVIKSPINIQEERWVEVRI